MYLQFINSDKHLPQSPFTGKFFRWRQFALVSIQWFSQWLGPRQTPYLILQAEAEGLRSFPTSCKYLAQLSSKKRIIADIGPWHSKSLHWVGDSNFKKKTRTWERFLRDASRPEVDILWRGVDGGVVLHGLVGHDADQVLPAVDGMFAAPLTPSEWSTQH